jgi:hypothetical protein
VKFDLTSKYEPVKRSKEYTTLQEETQKLVADFQSNLKSKIVAATKLDIAFLEQLSREELAKALRLATQAFLIINSYGSTHDDTDQMVNTILDRHGEKLLKPYGPITVDEFRKIYMTTHSIAALPNPLATVEQTVTTDTTTTSNTLTENTETRVQATVTVVRVDKKDRDTMSLFRTFESIFVVPWNVYINTTDKNDIDLELKKLSISSSTDTATAATAMEIDGEPTANPTLLKELISKMVKEKTTALQQKIDRLEKNKPRGQARGASDKKEKPAASKKNASTTDAGKNKSSNNNNKNKGKTNKNNNNNSKDNKNNKGNRNQKKNGNQKADDADNASSDDKKKSGNKKSNRSSRSKSPASNKNNRNSSNQSRNKRN